MAAKIRYKKWVVKIQHCPISSKFDMWVDNDVPNWFPTLKNFYRSPFSKWPPQYRTNSTLSEKFMVHGKKERRRIIIITRYDYNLMIMKSPKPATDTIYPHIKFWCYRTMLNFYPPFLCRVLAAILKMADILKILKTQNCSSNGDLSLCQILCLYHYLLLLLFFSFLSFRGPWTFPRQISGTTGQNFMKLGGVIDIYF
jgi:hypothetical protein